jgi:plasmid stabilization system protein ParE
VAEHRDKAPFLFAQELEAAFTALSNTPKVGRRWPHATELGVRRYLLATTRYHLYHREEENEVMILAVWGGPRGTGPDLGYRPF